LHFNQDEYAAAKPGVAHYGAPFVAPPGINQGYERHGPWRKRLWNVREEQERTEVLADRVDALEIVQQFSLLDPRRLEVSVTVYNHDEEQASPFECGLHYYWAVEGQGDLDLGDRLNDLPAWDNLARKTVLTTSGLVHAPELDLHVMSDMSALTFFDRHRDHSITLSLDAPSPCTTFVLYATHAEPRFRAIEQWSAAQEIEPGSWERLAHKIPSHGSATYRFTVQKG
jgi:galactose mutarotase-like enzyme